LVLLNQTNETNQITVFFRGLYVLAIALTVGIDEG
jgi:hypothetical protein